MKTRIILTLCFFFCYQYTIGQDDVINTQETKKSIFADVFFGTQISGIRKEDRVSNNFTPYIQLTIGKQIFDLISLSVNYQGPYFNFIGDDYRHHYAFIHGDVIFHIKDWLFPEKIPNWKVFIATGSGYFYNAHKASGSLAFNAGLINSYKISSSLYLKLKLSGIGGWKIYQHDYDAIPNASLGISKVFN